MYDYEYGYFTMGSASIFWVSHVGYAWSTFFLTVLRCVSPTMPTITT